MYHKPFSSLAPSESTRGKCTAPASPIAGLRFCGPWKEKWRRKGKQENETRRKEEKGGRARKIWER